MYNQNYDYISHHGILGQKWGIRRYQNKDGSLTKAGKRREAKQIKKINEQARKSGRLLDRGTSDIVGVRQKNGDILFVDRNEVNKKGVDAAERDVLNMIKEATARQKEIARERGKKKINKILESEEKTLVKDMLKNYDKSDPDMAEALEILRELDKDLK